MMKDWLKVTLLLCTFGALREIRPSEPFVSEFLLGDWRNITEDQLNREVYPIGTYCYLGLLVLVFLITDFLRFKPVIILSGLSGIAVYVILLWTTSLQWVQASQFFYGLYMATEVAYWTYIYAKVDSSKYPVVSSCTRMAALTGRFLSGASAQLLTHFKAMDYRQLNYITLTAQILATFWAFWLPPVQYSIYFHRKQSIGNSPTEPMRQQSVGSRIAEALTLIVRHTRSAYSRPKVLAWSVLYAIALALFVQTQTYIQLLWKEIQENTKSPVAYNGLVEALQTCFGAAGAYAAYLLSRSVLPAPAAAIQAVALYVLAGVPNIYASYAGYVVMGVMYNFVITLASAKIARQLSDDSCFGLIFGINTLLGTGIQSLLTAVLIQSLKWSLTAQYYTLCVLCMVLAVLWLLGWFMHVVRGKNVENSDL